MKKHLTILTFIAVVLTACSSEPLIEMDQDTSYIQYLPQEEELEVFVRYLNHSNRPVDFCVEILFDDEDIWAAFPYERYVISCDPEDPKAYGETSGELTILPNNEFVVGRNMSHHNGIDESLLPGNVRVRLFNDDGFELIEPLNVLN
ncbi:hypothetical protein [Jeotgalibacillus haloalkalitolerans]|uniref:Lipoprotein n=1 Tax=Jeotgalibacillus haloalkalitolerans TaxID=3104292 RepID=A0ABU5KHC5_9BACL|nr:hypothetical protein [Jeotgalibacillus sp. HH7-29]MDZ5710647.1 hypothetical protein [Jeotgalibacillus sp. HH7-29]